MQTIVNWIFENWLEILGVISGLIYLYFSINQKIWLWPLGIATSILYIFVYFDSKIYADMGLQFYYVGISIYGWFQWSRLNENNNKKELQISSLTLIKWVWLLIITSILFVIMAFILQKYTDSPVPYIDAFTTSASLVATWMLARKILEQWLWWVIIDAVSIGLYIYRELYITVILFTVYTILAIIGYIKWKQQLKNIKTI